MRTSKKFIAAVAARGLVRAACGDDDEDSISTDVPAAGDTSAESVSTEAPSTEAPSTEAPATEAPRPGAPSTEGPAALDLDTNGDGTVVFGIAAAGPRDDGGYYQALVDKAI